MAINLRAYAGVADNRTANDYQNGASFINFNRGLAAAEALEALREYIDDYNIREQVFALMAINDIKDAAERAIPYGKGAKLVIVGDYENHEFERVSIVGEDENVLGDKVTTVPLSGKGDPSRTDPKALINIPGVINNNVDSRYDSNVDRFKRDFGQSSAKDFDSMSKEDRDFWDGHRIA